MAEIVYLLINEAMPGLVKIGMTKNDLAQRMRELSQPSGVPLPFELFYACEVPDSSFVERMLHDAFGDHRVSKKREFFRIAPERVKAAMMLASKVEIRVGDAAFENPVEDKAEVEVAKRRARFRLSMIGIKPGTQLQLEKDSAVICTTVDEVNKVNFLGDEVSLSDAALQAVKALGYEWESASGPWEWTYQGRRLDEIRTEIDKRAD